MSVTEKGSSVVRANDVIEVLKPGCDVRIGENVVGKVIGVLLRQNNHISCEVVWFDNAQRFSAWMEASEIKPTVESKTSKIGFV